MTADPMRARLLQEKMEDRLTRAFGADSRPEGGKRAQRVTVCADCDHVQPADLKGWPGRVCWACGSKELVQMALFLCSRCGQLIMEGEWLAHKEGETGCVG